MTHTDAAEGFKPFWRYLLTLMASALTTGLLMPLLGHLDLANIVMLYLLQVLLIALWLGRGPSVLASLLNVLLFDVCFVPPRFSLAVSDFQYLVTFVVMLATGVVTGQLVAVLRQRAFEASSREQRTRALYELARELAGVMDWPQAQEAAMTFIRQHVGLSSTVLREEALALAHPPADAGCAVDMVLARMVLATGVRLPDQAAEVPHAATLYLPLLSASRVRGVLALAPETGHVEDTTLLETVASLLAITLERLHYVQVIHASELDMASERLRNSILSSLSHDLRTPLTALLGLADALFLGQPDLHPATQETARAIQEQAQRLTRMVANLLDLARLSAGPVRLRKEWQPLDEVVGASIQLLSTALGEHDLDVALAPDLPLLSFDAVLLERVLCNLIENAAKYSPPASRIVISAETGSGDVRVCVSDEGPGFPADGRDRLFSAFHRGAGATGQGAGLGLAICRAIVEAHGGRLFIPDEAASGGRICFTLPCGIPPELAEEEA